MSNVIPEDEVKMSHLSPHLQKKLRFLFQAAYFNLEFTKWWNYHRQAQKALYIQQYKKAKTKASNNNVISLTSSQKIWKDFCPYITTMKLADELCEICWQKNFDIAQASNLDYRIQRSPTAQRYGSSKRGQNQIRALQFVETKKPESLVVTSFDFTQNVSFPSSPQQVRTSYFKALRKCSIFGVRNEATQVQTNFLIGEEDAAGKGAKSVVSMLHC